MLLTVPIPIHAHVPVRVSPHEMTYLLRGRGKVERGGVVEVANAVPTNNIEELGMYGRTTLVR